MSQRNKSPKSHAPKRWEDLPEMLTAEEVAALRQDKKEATAWARAELIRQSSEKPF